MGSGRWPDEGESKESTEDYFSLDIREVKRLGLITPGLEELPGLARIEWIPAGFGNSQAYRPWFLCPRKECGRRVAVLYEETSPTGAPSWACRTCRDLCYPSESETRARGAVRRWKKAQAAFERSCPDRIKPPRMHHRTFVRLGRAYLEAQKEAAAALREEVNASWEAMEQERIKFDL